MRSSKTKWSIESYTYFPPLLPTCHHDYFGEESFHFLAGYCKIFIDHFLEIGSFLIGGMKVLADYHPHLLQSDHIVCALVLFMMPDTAFYLADGGLIETG